MGLVRLFVTNAMGPVNAITRLMRRVIIVRVRSVVLVGNVKDQVNCELSIHAEIGEERALAGMKGPAGGKKPKSWRTCRECSGKGKISRQPVRRHGRGVADQKNLDKKVIGALMWWETLAGSTLGDLSLH
jgi:hypothetical protein